MNYIEASEEPKGPSVACPGSGVTVKPVYVIGDINPILCPVCGLERRAKARGAVAMPEHRGAARGLAGSAEGEQSDEAAEAPETAPVAPVEPLAEAAGDVLEGELIEPAPGAALAVHVEPTAAPLAIPSVSLPAEDVERVATYLGKDKADGTLQTYAAHWRLFVAWCNGRNVTALPADALTVAAYISSRADAGRSASVIDLDLAAIGHEHERAGHSPPGAHPAVKRVRSGIRRTHGAKQKGKDALTAAELIAILDIIEGQSLIAVRDRALIAFGWASASRRSELAALTLANVAIDHRGARLEIERSKTDQEGEGIAKVVLREPGDVCPVRLLERWIQARGATPGPLFVALNRWGHHRGPLTGHDVARIVRARGKAAGLELNLSGHSLRSGFVTEAIDAGKPREDVQKMTAHKTSTMLDRYYRNRDLYTRNAGAGLLSGKPLKRTKVA